MPTWAVPADQDTQLVWRQQIRTHSWFGVSRSGHTAGLVSADQDTQLVWCQQIRTHSWYGVSRSGHTAGMVSADQDTQLVWCQQIRDTRLVWCQQESTIHHHELQWMALGQPGVSFTRCHCSGTRALLPAYFYCSMGVHVPDTFLMLQTSC